MTTVAISARPQPAWRKLLGFNLLTGIVLAVVGWLVGSWIGARIHAPSIDYFSDTGENDIGILLGYLFGVIGFLIGLGFANYPIRRLMGHPAKRLWHNNPSHVIMNGVRFRIPNVRIQYVIGNRCQAATGGAATI